MDCPHCKTPLGPWLPVALACPTCAQVSVDPGGGEVSTTSPCPTCGGGPPTASAIGAQCEQCGKVWVPPESLTALGLVEADRPIYTVSLVDEQGPCPSCHVRELRPGQLLDRPIVRCEECGGLYDSPGRVLEVVRAIPGSQAQEAPSQAPPPSPEGRAGEVFEIHEEPDDEMPMAFALLLIVGAAVLSFGLFVAPVRIDLKAYLFVAVAAAAAVFVNRPGKEGRLGWRNLAPKDHVNLLHLSGLLLVGGGMLAGVYKAMQYWFDGGADPYLYDVTLVYIGALGPLALIWVGMLLWDWGKDAWARDRTLQAINRMFCWWVLGYPAMWLGILGIILVLEG